GELPFQDFLDQYVAWMRDERGLTPSTVVQWQCRVKLFLQWCAATDRTFRICGRLILTTTLSVKVLSACRVSASAVASALRAFLHTATQGACDTRLAGTIRGPR